MLFWLGSPEVITGPRVAIVGTRRCTGTGAGVARELGRDLTAAGVAVVSGLAAGIDGAAHRGALDDGHVPPIGVAGNGLDAPYPSEQRATCGERWGPGVCCCPSRRPGTSPSGGGSRPATASSPPWPTR